MDYNLWAGQIDCKWLLSALRALSTVGVVSLVWSLRSADSRRRLPLCPVDGIPETRGQWGLHWKLRRQRQYYSIKLLIQTDRYAMCFVKTYRMNFTWDNRTVLKCSLSLGSSVETVAMYMYYLCHLSYHVFVQFVTNEQLVIRVGVLISCPCGTRLATNLCEKLTAW